MIRYGNDVELTELAMQITKEVESMNAHLRDGRLDSVFLRAQTMLKKLVDLQERLNDIKYRQAA